MGGDLSFSTMGGKLIFSTMGSIHYSSKPSIPDGVSVIIEARITIRLPALV